MHVKVTCLPAGTEGRGWEARVGRGTAGDLVWSRSTLQDGPLDLDLRAYGRGVGKRAEADLTLYTLGSPQHVSLRLSMPRWGMRGA